MSVRAMTAVFGWGSAAPWTPAQRLILLTLADHADDEGRCWPGAERIASKSAIDEKTVLRYLKILAEAGWVEVEQRRDRRQRQMTNLYHLTPQLLAGPGDNLSPGYRPTGEPGDERSPGLTQVVENGCEPGDNSSPSRVTIDTEPGDKSSPEPSTTDNHQTTTTTTSAPVLAPGSLSCSPALLSPGLGADGTEGGGGEEGGSEEETAFAFGTQANRPRFTGEYLERLGVSTDSVLRILSKVPLERIEATVIDYEQALGDGAKIGPGLLVSALLDGNVIGPARGRKGVLAAKGPPVARAIRFGVYRCKECGVERVASGASPGGDLFPLQACRECGGRAPLVRELDSSEVMVEVEA